MRHAAPTVTKLDVVKLVARWGTTDPVEAMQLGETVFGAGVALLDDRRGRVNARIDGDRCRREHPFGARDRGARQAGTNESFNGRFGLREETRCSTGYPFKKMAMDVGQVRKLVPKQLIS
jgi:hypothetical protein